MNISQLQENLEQMAKQAAVLDRQRGEHHVPLFDERLFGCRSRLLTPCVKEAKATLGAGCGRIHSVLNAVARFLP